MNYWHVQQHGQISDASVKKARLQRLHTVCVHSQATLSGHETDPWLPGAGLGGVVDCKEAQGTFWSDALYLRVSVVIVVPRLHLLELAEMRTDNGEF